MPDSKPPPPTAAEQPTPLLESALAIAREAHHGQRRRHGVPYIGHPIAVRQLAEDLASACGLEIDDGVRAVALLHDVLEDSDIGRAELSARFGEDVAGAVDLLTKTGKGPAATAAYYRRLQAEADDRVRLLKISDRVHNLSELHLSADEKKLDEYVRETIEYLVELARGARDPKVRAGLLAALEDAMRVACRAQRRAPPASLVVKPERVPKGIYAVISPSHVADSIASSKSIEETSRRIRELIEGGVAMVQVRAKGSTDREVLQVVEALLPPCRAAGVPLIVNDRADLCVAAGADGVHLGQTDLPPRLARRIIGVDALLGTSSHSLPELLEAGTEGAADLVAVGPVYPSPTKQGHAPVVGLDAFARRCDLSRLPVVAIGGVTSPARTAECARAGAHLVAAVSALDGKEARAMCRRMSATFAAACAATRAARSQAEPNT